MIRLVSGNCQAEILPLGAELCNLKNLQTEYVWQAKPDWPKHSPILFPIVGMLKNNSYQYNGKQYALNRHGFAREMAFALISHSENEAVFELQSNDATKKVYPFDFCLQVHYLLQDNKLKVTYRVKNTGDSTMYFSIGGHPAFKLPIDEALKFEDYTLQFEHVENCGTYPLIDDGLLLSNAQAFLENVDELKLQKPLFYKDALVFKNLQSKIFKLSTDKDSKGLIFECNDFPHLGIWSKKDADFICIEPWQGYSDHANVSGKIEEKEGIVALAAGKEWNGSWSVTVF